MLMPEQLYDFIPKKVEDWDTKDVEKWFRANNIQTTSTFSFSKERFNGQSFINVTPEYLQGTCGVTSRIIMKKILEWLEYEREDFEEYVEEQLVLGSAGPKKKSSSQEEKNAESDVESTERSSIPRCIIEVDCLPTEKDQINTPRNISDHAERHQQAIMPIEVQKWKKKKQVSEESILLEKVVSSKENSKKLSNKSENCILIGANFVKSSYQIMENVIEFKNDGKSQFLNNSGKIGRNTSNDIIIVGESVSRRHAQIIKDKNEFFLKDSESRFGTFIRIGLKNRKNIYEGDVIAFEDYEIEVLRYKFYKSTNSFDLKVRKLGEKDSLCNFFNKKYVMIGRQGKDISFHEPAISQTHARITFDSSGQLIIKEQEGMCFKKLKKDELLKIDEKDDALRFGLLVTDIKIINNRKSIPTISQFDSIQP